MKFKGAAEPAEARIDLTPMIDTVMFLLIFFMVTTNFHRQEADISFALPGVALQSESVTIPDEQIVEITEEGRVLLNDMDYNDPKASDMPRLVETLVRFRATAQANKSEAMITVAPAPTVKHQRVVDVLNACSAAGVSNVTFAVDEGEP
jgi:biopolymer transport protein ExbD